MVLDLAYQLAVGGTGFGKIALGAGRPVLYLALEDGPRRLQDRLIQLGVDQGPHRLFFATNVPRGEVVERCQAFIDEYQDQQPVVILDTLGKVAPPAQTGESDYQRDYRVGGALKAVADSAPGAAMIVVHHSRKADAEDFLDSVSGTQGLAGSADSILVLRRKRGETTGSLSVTSRDAAEGEYQLEMVDARWVLVGENLDDAADALRSARVTAGVGDRMVEVIETVGRFPEGIKPRDLKTLLPDVGNVDEYLRRAVDAGRLVKPKHGLYAPVSSVRSVSFSRSDDVENSHTHTSHTPLRLVTDETGEER
jgi:hypothetical protein